MSMYDVLLTALFVALGVLFVLNHRTGWLAARIVDAPRRHERLDGIESRRLLLDSDEQHDPV